MINNGDLPIRGEEPELEGIMRQATFEGRLIATTNYNLLDDLDVFLICVDIRINREK